MQGSELWHRKQQCHTRVIGLKMEFRLIFSPGYITSTVLHKFHTNKKKSKIQNIHLPKMITGDLTLSNELPAIKGSKWKVAPAILPAIRPHGVVRPQHLHLLSLQQELLTHTEREAKYFRELYADRGAWSCFWHTSEDLGRQQQRSSSVFLWRLQSNWQSVFCTSSFYK